MKKKNRGFIIPIFAFLVILLLLIMTAAGCNRINDNPSEENSTNDRISVIATIFPIYDFVRIIGGNHVEVRLLLPPGVEAHAYEPTPGDVIRMNNSDLFIYTNISMEPWVGHIMKSLDSEKTRMLEISTGIELYSLDETEHGDSSHPDTDINQSDYDPHIWLDPVLAMRIVDNIESALSALKPEFTDYFASNASVFSEKLSELDSDFRDLSMHCQSKTIVYGGHFAFGYFARRYGFEYVSPYAGFSPDTEPTPGRIIDIVNVLKSTGSNTVFFGELADPKVARAISRETGAKMLLLHAAHNISKEELAQNTSYLEIMQENLKQLEKGLGYK